MPPVAILVDEREKNSGVPDLLTTYGTRVVYGQLKVGDYVLSPIVGVERKSLRDFLSSIYDGRVFRQCRELAATFVHPLLVIEGNVLELSEFLPNPKVFYGALASLALERVKLLTTPSVEGTARLLFLLAKRVSGDTPARSVLEKVKKTDQTGLQQLYMVASLPGVGEKLARSLLLRFRTPRRVFGASVAELARVPSVGRSRALKIKRALDQPYQSWDDEERRQVKLTDSGLP